MGGQLLQQLYNTVDGIIVGNYVGEEALAAVGSCAVIAFVFLAIAMGLSNGASVMIAQLFGAGRTQELKRAASTAFILLASIGVVLSVFGAVFARVLTGGLLSITDPKTLEMSVSYLAIYSAGLVFQFIYNSIAAVLRAVGDSRATLYFLLVCTILNLGLDLLFVAGFGWGVAGAAIATVLSQLVCVIVSVIYLLKKHDIFKLSRESIVFDKELCALCLKLGIPTAVQQFTVSFGMVFVQRLINSFGTETMAAFTVGTRIDNYVFAPVFGFQMGMSAFTGQNVGSRQLDRVKRGMRSTIVMSVSVSVVVSALIYIFASPIATLFGVEGRSLAISVELMRFMTLFFWMFAWYQVIVGVLQGSGDVIVATASTICAHITRVILAYILVYAFSFNYSAVWIAMPVGWGIAIIISGSRYLSGAWKRKGIVGKATGEEVQ